MAKDTGLLTALNAKLAKKIETAKASKAAEAPVETKPETREPTILEILDNAIGALPKDEIEFNVLQRYASGVNVFKQRCLDARQALCTVRTLLVDEE